jgi:uncharacterized repeat protein (TIGR02543 family)
MDAKKKVTAHFMQQYALATSVMPVGTGTISPDQQVMDANSSLTVKANPAAGYKFDHWSGDLQGTSSESTVTMDGVKNVTANFVKIQYSVSLGVVPADAGTVTPDPETYDAGDLVSFTATPNKGYVFDSWSGDVTGSSEKITFSMDKNKDIYANFKKVETAPSITTMDILEAQSKGMVEVSAKGQSLAVIYLSVTSKSANPLKVTISPGTVFDGPTAATSSMVVLAPASISLEPYRISSQNQIIVATRDMDRGMPTTATTLSLSQTPISGDLKLFVDYTTGSSVSIQWNLGQYGVWTIQNNPERLKFLQIGSGSTYGLPTDQQWTQIKDLFQKAGIDTSKYKTFK